MFQFRPFPSYTYFIQCTLMRYCRTGFPHSDIYGSMRMCRSPSLIAACHVLLRLLMPRHSPCALISLTISSGSQKELCRSQKFSFLARIVVLPIIPQKNLFASPSGEAPSVALLFSHLFHCSVFKVQAEDTFSCTL